MISVISMIPLQFYLFSLLEIVYPLFWTNRELRTEQRYYNALW